MPDEEHLNELAQNVRDLIAEAELLLENRHWARAAGLAIYAGEEAIKFDFIKNHPENTPDTHKSRGGVWNQHDQNAYVSAACQNVFIPPELYFADIPGRAQLESKAARGNLYRNALREAGLSPRHKLPPWMRDLPRERQRSFYVDPGHPGPSSVTEEQARAWIDRAKKLTRTTWIFSR